MKIDEPLTSPLFQQSAPNQTIHLSNEEVEYVVSGQPQRHRADVSVSFVPTCRLIFQMDTHNYAPLGMAIFSGDGWDGQLTFPNRGTSIHAICVQANQSGLWFVPKREPIVFGESAADIRYAVFHVFNFPDFISPNDCVIQSHEGDTSTQFRCGRVVLEADDWRVTIAANASTRDMSKRLKSEGGHVITHVAKVEKRGNGVFSAEELAHVRAAMHHFLSLALGRWAGLALGRGFDADGNRVWEEWGMPVTHQGAWRGLSWFDDHHGDMLSAIFPAFWRAWQQATWNLPLQKAVYWYVAANERGTGVGVDAGLVLAQAALELLAWTYCIQHRGMVSAKAFGPRGLTAADKLRMLTSSLSIPSEIPSSLKLLSSRPGRPWDDSLDAIAAVRNSIVHPDTNASHAVHDCREALHLSLWLLDLIFLRLLGYDGKYSNRLAKKWRGEVETVPWAGQPNTPAI